ncbi:MAG: GNAT family N-acetyltransferase [Aggregatilineaceae bacterium]
MQPFPDQTFTRADLVIRPAQPSDREALEAIAAQIWDGNDYLPRVLDTWLNDPYDGFFVATLRDRVIGVSKITRLDEAEWWLEGLRVDPAFQGYGFGRILHHFAVTYVRQHGQGVVRFSTSSENKAVQRLARETGFSRVAIYVPLGADVLDEPVAHLSPLSAQDAPRVRAWLDGSAYFVACQRSIEWNWSFYYLTDARLTERLSAGLVYGWAESDAPQGLRALVIANPAERDRWPDQPVLKIAYLDAAPANLTALAQDIRRLAAHLGRVYVRLKVLEQPDWLAAFEAAGYLRESDHLLWLYARDVSLTAHADVRLEELPSLSR